MAPTVGIDLGTTNSVVAVLEGGEPTVIPNSEGSRTTPFVVAFAGNGEVLVGQSAKNQAVTVLDRTVRSAKRHVGSNWTTPDIDGKKYVLRIVEELTDPPAGRAAELGRARCRGRHRRPHRADRAGGSGHRLIARP